MEKNRGYDSPRHPRPARLHQDTWVALHERFLKNQRCTIDGIEKVLSDEREKHVYYDKNHRKEYCWRRDNSRKNVLIFPVLCTCPRHDEFEEERCLITVFSNLAPNR